MTHNETAHHAADLVLRAGSVTKLDTSIEAVFDKAAQDLRIPLSSQAIYWRPRHMQTSVLVGQIPFIFWLMETIRPTSVVQIGTADGVVYMSLCQAVERLNLHASCLGLETRTEQFHDELRRQHEDQYTDFSILLRDELDVAIHYVQDTIDFLVLHDVLDDAEMDRVVDEWLPLLSDRAVILICEPGRILLNERLRQALDEKPDQSVITGPASLGGSRLDVILHGANQPERLQALASLRQGHPAYLAARMVFNRLGQGLEETQRARELQRQRDQALAFLHQKQQDEVTLQNEIENLKKGLQDFEIVRTTTLEENAALQNEAGRLEFVLSDKTQENENLQHQLKNHQIRLERSEIALNAAMAKIEALENNKLKRVQMTSTDDNTVELERLKKDMQELRVQKDKELTTLRQEVKQRVDDIAVLTEHFNREMKERRAESDRLRQQAKSDHEQDVAREVGKVVSAIFRGDNKEMWRKGIAASDHVNLLVTHKILDPDWYKKQNVDVVEDGIDPALHYLMYGAAEGRAPRKFT